MLIGIDLLAMQHPDFRHRGTGRYVFSLINSLYQFDKANSYVLFSHADLERDCFPWEHDSGSSGRWQIETVSSSAEAAARPGDPLDLLLLTLPFSDRELPSPSGYVRVAAIIYDLIPFLFPSHYLFDRATSDHYFAALHTLRKYDGFLTISGPTRKDCQEFLGLPSTRLHNLGCAVREGFESAGDSVDEAALRDLGIRGPFIFNVGGCDPRKNLERLMSSFGRLPEHLRQNYQLVIACRLLPGWREVLERVAEEDGVRDRLVLTDAVSDSVLRSLYQRCDLFVFPSLYEGAGQPILEAMSCGAPVIAGANSAMIDVVGDAGVLVTATDVEAITLGMRELLADNQRRDSMRRKGRERSASFRWQDVAGNAIAALQAIAAPPTRRPARSGLPRIAFFSPLPPKESGIADYSFELLEQLQHRFRVDLYHDVGYEPNAAVGGTAFKAFDYRMFPARNAAMDYCQIVYQMGNCATYHRYMYETLMRYPGVVTLHDFFLGDFYLQLHDEAAANRHLEHAVRRSCPEPLASRLLELAAADGASFKRELHAQKNYLNDLIFDHAAHVVMHEAWNVNTVLARNPGWAARISLIPFGSRLQGQLTPAARDKLRCRYQLPDRATLIGCFGVAAPTKLTFETLIAFQEVANRRPNIQLVFAGASTIDLASAVREFGLTERVRILGRVSAEDFAALAGTIDIGVNLRRPPTNGETSASLFHLLSCGVPTIVTDVDAFSGLPDDVVVKLPWGDAVEQRLASALMQLLDDPAARSRISQAALTYLRRRHDWAAVAEQYAEVILRSAQRPKRLPPSSAMGRTA